MRIQVIASIVLLATLASSVQGLFVSQKLSAVSAAIPLVGNIASGVTSTSSGPKVDTAVVEEVPVHIERRYRTIPVPVPVYSYAPLYSRPVYYSVGTNFGGVGRAIGNLLAAPVKAIGSIKGAVGSALSSSGSSRVEAYVSTY